jgi:hypothetical protein
MNIVNYQEDVVNKLQIHKIADNVPAGDIKKLLDEYHDDYDCVSTLTDEIIKPTYETTDDHIIAIIPVKRNGYLFRFNKIQFMEDNVAVDNVVIDKIQMGLLGETLQTAAYPWGLGGRVISDDLEKLNIYFPLIIVEYNPIEIRVFIDKTSITLENLNKIDEHFNVMLTYDLVFLNQALGTAISTQDYELFEGMYKNGITLITPH